MILPEHSSRRNMFDLKQRLESFSVPDAMLHT